MNKTLVIPISSRFWNSKSTLNTWVAINNLIIETLNEFRDKELISSYTFKFNPEEEWQEISTTMLKSRLKVFGSNKVVIL